MNLADAMLSQQIRQQHALAVEHLRVAVGHVARCASLLQGRSQMGMGEPFTLVPLSPAEREALVKDLVRQIAEEMVETT